MRQIAKRFWAAGACVLAACLLWGAAATAQSPDGSHAADLSRPRVDMLGDGRIAVTLEATGELAGVITLMLTPKGDGTYGGEWGMTVGHVDNSDPETGVEPGNDHEHADGEVHEHAEADETEVHRDFVRIVRRGSLSGTIVGASLALGAHGLEDLAANLEVTRGEAEFEGAFGAGLATLTSLTFNF